MFETDGFAFPDEIQLDFEMCTKGRVIDRKRQNKTITLAESASESIFTKLSYVNLSYASIFLLTFLNFLCNKTFFMI